MSGNPTNQPDNSQANGQAQTDDQAQANDQAQLSPEDFAYFSARDIDQDGTNDVIHTVTHSGVQMVHHLDHNEEVQLIEVDADGDGILEATIREIDETTAIIQQDTDGDGEVDTVEFYGAEQGRVFQKDTIQDGRVVSTQLDLDGDGVTDMEFVDADGDGQFDVVAVDSDGDGYLNSVFVDTDGDGSIDQISSDVDNLDGVLETTITSNDLGTQDLGSMDEFTTLIEYHAEETPDADPNADI